MEGHGHYDRIRLLLVAGVDTKGENEWEQGLGVELGWGRGWLSRGDGMEGWGRVGGGN